MSNEPQERYRGSCHCQAVQFEVSINDISDIRRCNCSMCSRKGIVMASCEIHEFNLVQGEEALSLYQFNTGVAEHYFCKHCGIATHHRRRAKPNEYAVNIACLEGIAVDTLQDIPWLNGKEHSADTR